MLALTYPLAFDAWSVCERVGASRQQFGSTASPIESGNSDLAAEFWFGFGYFSSALAASSVE